MTRWPLLVSASVLILSCWISCTKKPDNTIKIGLAAAQTGSDGMFGTAILNGAELAIDEWNARGGVLGKKIVMIRRDDEAKPDKAVTVAQELADAGVFAVIGHFNSGCTLPASEIYNRYQILNATTASNARITERGYPSIFRVGLREDQQARIAAEFARRKLGIMKVAILHDKTAYGEGLAAEMKKSFEELGGKVVMYDGLPKSELDFRSEIALVKQSGAEALFWGGLYGQAGVLITQLREADVNIPFLSGSGTFFQALIDTAGNHVTGVYLAYGPDYKNLPSARHFLEAYHNKYGPEGSYSIYGYDAANVICRGIESAGTLDPTAVTAAIRRLTFQGALGPEEFDEKGDLKKSNLAMWTIQDGQFKLVP